MTKKKMKVEKRKMNGDALYGDTHLSLTGL
jgi:hypothetical protein